MKATNCIVAMIILSSCQPTASGDKAENPFYTVSGGWDWDRLPLIYPYELMRADPKMEPSRWNLDLKSVSFGGTSNVRKVAVHGSIVYVRCGSLSESDFRNTRIGTRNHRTAWYILEIGGREIGISDSLSFDSYILEKELPKPLWYSVDSLHNEFARTKKLPWRQGY